MGVMQINIEEIAMLLGKKDIEIISLKNRIEALVKEIEELKVTNKGE